MPFIILGFHVYLWTKCLLEVVMHQIHPLIIQYFEAWVSKKRDVFMSTLHEDFYCKECTGDIYEGLEISARWFDSWHNEDNRVLSWSIKDAWHTGNQWFVTWTFKCRFDGEVSTFDGMSRVLIEGNKIKEINEYSQFHESRYPYGRSNDGQNEKKSE